MANDAGSPAPLVTVVLPTALRSLFPGSPSRVEIAAWSVAEMLDGLEARWPGMRDRLCDSRPAIRRHVNIFVDGDRSTLETRLAAGTEVYVLTAMSGG